MAGSKLAKPRNLVDAERAAFRERFEGTERFVEKAVCDVQAHEKLDAIANALGAATNTTPTIFNVSIISANTEVSQALPANTKSFVIRSRDKGRLRLAYSLGGTNSDYLTIPTGSSFKDTNFYTSVTLYVQSTKPGDVVEIVAYS